MKTNIHKINKGFSLIEMAIVLFIVALLLGGLLPTVSRQIEQQRTIETRKQLDEIQQALIGYAIINRRLPCPASATNNGVESFDTVALGDASNGRCLSFNSGFVPAATLGIATSVDNQGNKGFAVDSWGNRIRYAITQATSRAFTTTDGMKTSFSTLSPNLLVCSSSTYLLTPITDISCINSANSLTSSPGVPVVIFSTGKNGASVSGGADETANIDGGTSLTFVSRTPTTAPNEFDDLVIWLSPNILINRMVSAGQLP